jgi:hypothetical protein
MNSVFNKGFSLEILSNNMPVQKIIYNKSSYYALYSNSYYKIRLTNTHNVRVDAHIYIGGQLIGVYRINPNSTIVVNNDNIGNNLIMMKHQNFASGLVKIVFVPEKYENSTDYMNPSRISKPDVNIYRWNCYSDYTDGVTPHNVNNKRCIVDALDYEINQRPVYGRELEKTFIKTNNRYQIGPKINNNNIDTNNITTIYAQLYVNDDKTFYTNPYKESIHMTNPLSTDTIEDPEIIPPNIINTLKKMGRHKCPSFYNRSYQSDNNTCSNHVTVNGNYKLPPYGRYTNGVFGGPSYNSWILGSAAPMYINKNIYRDNNYL